MNAAGYMEYIRGLKRSIELIEQELKTIDEEMISTPGISYDSNRVTSSPRQDKLEMQVIRLVEAKEEKTSDLVELKTKYLNEMHTAMAYIRMIPSEEQQDILIMRYVENRKWWDILRIRNCDNLSGQMRLRDRAIEALQMIIGDKESV